MRKSSFPEVNHGNYISRKLYLCHFLPLLSNGDPYLMAEIFMVTSIAKRLKKPSCKKTWSILISKKKYILENLAKILSW